MMLASLLKLILVCLFIQAQNCESLFLSNNGIDIEMCGSKKLPCRNFDYIVKKASENDTINIMAKKKYEIFDICKHLTSPIKIEKTLTIRGFEYVPMLVCFENDFMIFVNGSRKDIHIRIEDIAFKSFNSQNNITKASSPHKHGLLKLINANISIKHCIFINMCTAINANFNRKSFSILFNYTEFQFVSYVLYSEAIYHGYIQIDNTKIIGNANLPGLTSHAISLSCFNYLSFQMTNTAIQRTHEGLSITMHDGYPEIILKSIIFTKNNGQSVIVTFGANTNREKTVMSINNVQFIENSGVFASALHLLDKKVEKEKIKINVENSLFHNNVADTFFGAVYADGVSLYILKTIFTNNAAGKLHGSIQGFGGAVYVEAETNVFVEESMFINNTCSGFGGTIFSRGRFSCINCEFIGPSDILIRPLLGDILYATAGLYLLNTTWRAFVMKEIPRSLIWHPGSPTVESWEITVKGYFKASCPEGHNISYFGIVRNIDVSSRMEMSCKPCPRNEYSLTSGALTVRHKNGIAHETEKVVANCHPCKYGGICNKGSIRPQANYYGFRTGPENDQVRFISCPVGYCCQGDSCQKYNSCQKYRTGLLCGRCKNNMSENLINANCVPPQDCNDIWFWLLFLPTGLLYIIIFMYLDHISYFLKTQLIWWDVKVLHRHDLEDYEIVNGTASSQNQSIDDVEEEEISEEISERITLNKSEDFANGLDQKDIFAKPGNKERGPDLFTDLISISFYFFQMFLLMRMRESIVLEYLWSCLRSIYSSMFTLSVHANSSLFLCPIHGLTAVTKVIFIKSFSCYILVLLFILHSLVYLIQYILLQDLRRKEALIVFSIRLKVATIRILLIAYATIGETAVTLVTCIPMTKKSVLLIDGTITCYTWWQILTFLFIFTWVIPFPIVLVLSLVHLKKDIISYNQFVLAWVFPLPYFIWSQLYLKCFKIQTVKIKKQRLYEHESFELEEELSIKEILFRLECSYMGNAYHLRKNTDVNSSPLKEKTNVYRIDEPLFWQGAMIGRRLILILTLTFVTQPVMKYYCALLLCLLYLIHQLYYRPYVISLANMYETITSTTLVMFCSMNLFFAYSYVSDLQPEAADQKLSFIFRWFEAVILVIMPTLVAFIILCLVLTRVFILLVKLCQIVVELCRRPRNT